jgi:hypothetical protein
MNDFQIKKRQHQETRIRQFVWCLCMFLFCSCGTSGALMTMHSFYEIPIGSSSSEIVAQVGEPYQIHKLSDGSVEYEYIERLNAGIRNFEECHYYLLLKEDRVVSKRMKQITPPPYRFDSYDMQTTQNQRG